jgi:hypothetical protein
VARTAVRIDEDDPDEDFAADAPPATAAAEPPPEPEQARAAWLVPEAVEEEPARYPIPPAANGRGGPQPAAVPTWSYRAPPPAPPAVRAPVFADDPALEVDLDPLSLRRRATIRAGASVLTVDEMQLAMRTWWRRRALSWSEVQGFEPRFDAAAARSGRLVAVTRNGPVELPATKRPVAELRYLHALLDAYRRRALLLAHR